MQPELFEIPRETEVSEKNEQMDEEGDSDNFKYIGGKLFVNVNQLTVK